MADSGITFKSQLSHITSMEIDLEIISGIFLSILLIQEGQLSVTHDWKYVHKYWLTDQRTEPAQDWLEMIIHHFKQTRT